MKIRLAQLQQAWAKYSSGPVPALLVDRQNHNEFMIAMIMAGSNSAKLQNTQLEIVREDGQLYLRWPIKVDE